jgi:hypothetical protein
MPFYPYRRTRHIKHTPTAETPCPLKLRLPVETVSRLLQTPSFHYLRLYAVSRQPIPRTVPGSCVVTPEKTSFYRFVAIVVVVVSPSRALMAYRGEPARFELSPNVSPVADRLNLQLGTRNPALSSSSGSAQLVPMGNQQAIACLYFCASRPIMACDCGSRSWSKATREVLIGEAGDADGEEGIVLASCI